MLNSIKCSMKQSMRARMFELIVLLSVIIWQALPVEGVKHLDRPTPMTRELDKKKYFKRRAYLTLWGAKGRDVSSKKILIYEEAFVIAYNRLVKRLLSRSGSKLLALRVTNVNFVPDSIFPSDFSSSEISLMFDVTFTCKFCDGESTLFRSDDPTRKLYVDREWDSGIVLDSQDVDLNPEIDDGQLRSRHLSAGPFPARNFTITYNDVLKTLVKKRNSLIPASKWSDVDQGCTDGNTFETSIVLQLLLGEQLTITPGQLNSLAQGVVESYNTLNVPSEAVCDPFYHRAIAAVAEVIETDAVSIPSNRNRRNLATRLTIKVSVSFQCKACSSGSKLLRNDAARRNRQLEPRRYLVGGGKSQQQRTLATDTSGCTCPVGSEADVPTYSDLADQLNDYIATKITDLDARVDKVKEIVDESCPGSQVSRVNLLRFDAIGCATPGDLLAVAIKNSMNELLSKFCDTQYRTVASVEFDYAIGDRSKFIVIYTCRDCPSGTLLLDPRIPFTTFASIAETRDGGHVRRLPEFNNVCYCDVGADNTRIPTVDEFATVMLRTVQCSLTSIAEEADR